MAQGYHRPEEISATFFRVEHGASSFFQNFTIYQPTWHHMPDDCIHNCECSEDFKSHGISHFYHTSNIMYDSLYSRYLN
jgi:hypothetical protein